MIDVRPALERFGISSTSAMHAVQQVRIFIEDGGDADRIARTNDLLEKVLGVRLAPTDINDRPVGDPYAYAITIAQAAVESVIKQEGRIDDVDLLMENAKIRADKFITNPAHKWMFALPEVTVDSTTEVAVTDTIETKVAVKADGSIKKGGKQVLAAALYQKYVIEATVKPTNKWFKELLCKEIQLTAAGASTYAYNCDAKLKLLVKESKSKAE